MTSEDIKTFTLSINKNTNIELPICIPKVIPDILLENLQHLRKKNLNLICDTWDIPYVKKNTIYELKSLLNNKFSIENPLLDYENSSSNSVSSSDSEDSDNEYIGVIDNNNKNPIISCINNCYNILHENNIVGERAIHDIIKLIFIKCLEPIIETTDLMDNKYYIDIIEDFYKPGLETIVKFSELRKKYNYFTNTNTLIWIILQSNPITSIFFNNSDFWNCEKELLGDLIIKIDDTFEDKKIKELSVDDKYKLYAEFLDGYASINREFKKYHISNEYIKFILSGLSKSPDMNILNLCMGTGVYLSEMCKYFPYTCNINYQDIDVEIYIYAVIGILISTRDIEKVKPIDYPILDHDPNEKFDLIITAPRKKYYINTTNKIISGVYYNNLKTNYETKYPIIENNFPKFEEMIPIKSNNKTAILLQYIAFKLKPYGTAVIIIPNSEILRSKKYTKLRNSLICNNKVQIEKIIYTNNKNNDVIVYMKKLDNEIYNEIDNEIEFLELSNDFKTTNSLGKISIKKIKANNYIWDIKHYNINTVPLNYTNVVNCMGNIIDNLLYLANSSEEKDEIEYYIETITSTIKLYKKIINRNENYKIDKNNNISLLLNINKKITITESNLQLLIEKI